jgi:molybdopterin molybdotransferase
LPEFLALLPSALAQERLSAAITQTIPTETIPAREAFGRILRQDVFAPHALPQFRRSTVDGYAVIARNTFGASPSLPQYLDWTGEVHMGRSADIAIQDGECVSIHTGGMLPDSADAVVMLEYTQMSKPGQLEVQRAVSIGENVIAVGEEVQAGETILAAGKQLRESEIGALMAFGVGEVAVSRSPIVGILSSGDEVVPPDAAIKPGQVRDINSYSISSLVRRHGGEPRLYGIVPDNLATITEVGQQAHSECDIVVITAGSSASARDHTVKAIEALGAPGVLAHGVNIKPGKPTILAVSEGKPVLGLPGNPVSAFLVARIFLRLSLDKLVGKIKDSQFQQFAKLTINLASQSGREDWVPAVLSRTTEELTIEPVFGRSNMILTLVRANALIRIPPEKTGHTADELVEVHLL